MDKVNVLSVQFCPQTDKREENFRKVEGLIEKNSGSGLDLIVLPEFFNTGLNPEEFKRLCEKEQTSKTLEFFGAVARKYSSYIVVGSIVEADGDNLYNTSWLLDRSGNKVAKYRKIHLFDRYGGTEHLYNTPGDKIVVAQTDFGKIGMSICFDIKFPEHYIELTKLGAQFIVAPAAWCVPNAILEEAREAWVLMNRMRAMDSNAYFISSNSCGEIDGEFHTCANSMIVGPDGKIIANAGEKEGVAFAQLECLC